MFIPFSVMPVFYGESSYNDSLAFYDALDWLVKNFEEFPTEILGNGLKDISIAYYKSYRFVVSVPDEELVFSDCRLPGITEQMFNEYKYGILYI